MRVFSVRWRITFGLVCLLTSLLVIAELIGVNPNENRATVRGRAQLCEAIAINASVFVSSNDIANLETVLRAVVQRNPSLESAAIRRNGKLLFEVGDHVEQWIDVDDTHSTETHVHVPISSGNQKWGTVQLRFASLGGDTLWARIISGDLRFLTFLSAGSFVTFWLYLGRTLQQIDPSRAVPSRVRSALDTLTEGLLVVDRQNRIVLANEAFASWVGKEPDVLMGQRANQLPWVLTPEQANDRFPWQEALANEEPVTNTVLQLCGSDKKQRTLQVNSSPVMGQNGRYGGVLTSFEDVTELEESRAELSKAKDAADMANRAKSDFLARMSHEIRTPMNAILGFTDVLRRGIDKTSQDRQHYLDTIHASGEHLLALINDILDLSKIESGRMELELGRQSPYEMISHVVSVFRMKAEERQIDLTFQVDGQIPESILTDKVRFRQTIMNLVSNSIKFTKRGSVRIVTRLEAESTPKPLLAVEVIDTGVGISKDAADRIFQPFAQADSSITRRFGGTGLGLAIVHQLSEALGGTVAVDSQKGVGSTFRVTFATGPLDGIRLLDGAALESMHSDLDDPDSDQRTLPPAKVLVVDDAEANRELIAVFLNELGAEVDTAENGRVAVERVSMNRYDAVLMDMQMPIMDGYSATEELRQMGCTLPIIALTANAMESDEMKCREAGCSGFLTKPVDIDQLYQTLAEILASSQMPATGTAEIMSAPLSQPESAEGDTLRRILADAVQLRGDAEQARQEIPTDDRSPVLCSLPVRDPRFRPIVERFVTRLEEQLNQLHEAVASRDWESVRTLAHWIKGTAGTAGFSQFTEPASHLEQLAIEEKESEIPDAVLILRDLANRIQLPSSSDT